MAVRPRLARTENASRPEGGVDSPNPPETDNGSTDTEEETETDEEDGSGEGAEASDGTRPFVPPTDDGDQANAADAPRNSGGAQTLSGEGSETDEVPTSPSLATATAPTADPAFKPNMHESIPTHTVGMGDVNKTAMSGVVEPGDEVHVRTDVDYFDPKNVLDLNDPVATQIAHLNGGAMIAVGEGRRVDTRTVSGEGMVYNVGDAAAIGKLKEGDQFYALWLFNPGSDSIRWRNDHIEDLKSGRMLRNGLPASYWANHSATRPPLCERTATGFKVLD